MKIFLILIVTLVSNYCFSQESISKNEDSLKDTKIISLEFGKTPKPIEIYVPVPEIWKVKCKKDRFDDFKICEVSKNSQLVVSLIEGKYFIEIEKNNSGYKKIAIRIDNKPTIYGVYGVIPEPKLIIEQMKKGRIVYTRYAKYPNGKNIDNEINLDGFTKAFNEMLLQYSKL